MPTNGSNQMLNNSTKQVNKVKPNVNRQPPDSVVSPSTYNRWVIGYYGLILTNGVDIWF